LRRSTKKVDRHATGQTAAERHKLMLIRQASAAFSNRLTVNGCEKTRGPKPKPVTLPAAEELKRFERDDE
jgi:hypothetical protein